MCFESLLCCCSHFPTAPPTALPFAPTAAAAAKYLQPLPSAPLLVTPTAVHFTLEDSYSSDDISSNSSSRRSIQNRQQQQQQQQLVVAESTATPPAPEAAAVATNEVYGSVADAMHFPWTVKLLGLAVVNIVLLRLVLQLIRRFQESKCCANLAATQLNISLDSENIISTYSCF